MKRALSFILALTLALTLFPTFAMAETTETAVPTAFTVSFNGADTTNITKNTETKWYIEGKQKFSGKNWELLTDVDNSTIYNRNEKVTVQYVIYKDKGYISANTTKELAEAGSNVLAVKIIAPASGLYNISGHMYFGSNGGNSEIVVGNQSAGTVNSNKTTSGGLVTQHPVAYPDSVFLVEGENVLKIINTIDSNASQISNGFYDFTFTPADVTAAKIVLPETLTIGEKVSVGLELTAGGKNVSYNEIRDGMEVVLSSDSSSVKAGEKAVAAYLEGTANITAQVNVNGVALTAEPKQIKVSKAEEAKEFTLDFSAPISSIDLLYKSDEGNYYIHSDSTMFGVNWEAVTSRNVSTLLKSTNRIRYFKDSRILVYAYSGDFSNSDGIRDTMAFDFYVPADGMYDLSAVVWKSKAAGYASLYIDDAFVGKHDLYNAETITDFLIEDYGKAFLTSGKHRLKIVCAASTVATSANPFCNIKFTPATETEKLADAFTVVETPANDYVKSTVIGIKKDGTPIEAEPNADGITYKITAPETGNKFLYWALGLVGNKRIVSFDEAIENYVPAENGRNYLIAVYEGDVDTTEPEYYNQNGQLIPGANENTTVSMPGYGSTNKWVQYGTTNIWVADYEKKKEERGEATITAVGGTVNGKDAETVLFGTEVTCTATATDGEGKPFKCWKKSDVNGDEIVSVDKTYKFKAWETCTVTAVYVAHTPISTAMKIIIDDFAVGTDTGVMAEFIGFEDEDVVEKGIKFTATGETEAIKIPMTTTDNQLTVVADAGKYEGYAILRNETAFNLITDGLYEHN